VFYLKSLKDAKTAIVCAADKYYYSDIVDDEGAGSVDRRIYVS